MNKKVKYIMILFILHLCVLSGCSGAMSAEEEMKIYDNADRFYENLVEECTDFNEINLKDLTPFDWDELYIFGTYYYADQIREKTGVKWDGFRSSEIEDTANMVFLKDGKVVCYYYEHEIGKRKFLFEDVYEEVAYAADDPKIKLKAFRDNNIFIEMIENHG